MRHADDEDRLVRTFTGARQTAKYGSRKQLDLFIDESFDAMGIILHMPLLMAEARLRKSFIVAIKAIQQICSGKVQ